MHGGSTRADHFWLFLTDDLLEVITAENVAHIPNIRNRVIFKRRHFRSTSVKKNTTCLLRKDGGVLLVQVKSPPATKQHDTIGN